MGEELPSLIRVLRLITRLNVGGPTRHVLTLTEKLAAHGFQSELVAGSVGYREGEIEPGPGVSIRHVPHLRRGFNPASDCRAAMDISNIIRDRRPLIVHTHLAKAGAIGRLAARRAGVPVIIHTFHGHVLREYFAPPINKVFVEIERRLARITSVLVAVSTSVRDELLHLGVGHPSQWRVIPLGLELKHLSSQAPTVTEARAKLGLPLAGPVVGIVGRLAPIKDHDTFLEACRHIASVQPEATFVIAGDGELRDELEVKARAALGDRVIFLGWVLDLPALYAALDVVVLTSRNEGTPVALIEAAASSRAVVATRVGGVKDVVKDGHTGFLVSPGDSEGVAKRVLDLLKNPEWAQSCAKAGQAYVTERFTAERLTDDVASLYRDIVGIKGLWP